MFRSFPGLIMVRQNTYFDTGKQTFLSHEKYVISLQYSKTYYIIITRYYIGRIDNSKGATHYDNTNTSTNR